MATRSGLRAAFFALCVMLVALLGGHAAPAWGQAVPSPAEADLGTLQAHARAQQLAASPTWHALLHLQGGQPQVRDPRFLLSAPAFSPQAELDATLALLHASPPAAAQAAQCRFPARDAWLRAQLQLPAADTRHCEAWQTFVQRAPMARVALVFAAEVLSQPSSMMGHLFLRADGRTAQGQDVAHAISFFTDAGSWNLPKLFYDTMVVGSRGHFALTPYRQAREHYAVEEQRTLWQFTLNLTDIERQRLQAHMEELRQVRLTYFFQSYNCATLVDHLLRVARPTQGDEPGSWTTPREVLRRAQQQGLIADVAVETPARWRIRALSETLPPHQVRAVDAAVQTLDLTALQAADTGDATQDFLRWQLAEADLSWRQGDTRTALPEAASKTATFRQGVQAMSARFAHLELDASASQHPTQTPPERQWGVAWQARDGEGGLLLRAMPASHRLEDDNRSRGVDSGLRLFEPVVWLRADRAQAKLASFTLYSMRSHLPRDAITGGLSGTFYLGWSPQASARQPTRQAWLTEGSIGATWRLHDDLDAYGLLGGGVGWRQGAYAYVQPELGVVIREVANLKSWARVQWLSRPMGDGQPSLSWIWTQSWSPRPQWSVQAEWQAVHQDHQVSRRWQLGVTHLY